MYNRPALESSRSYLGGHTLQVQIDVFDPNMNMSAHVSKVVKSANYHLRNIGKRRKCLNTDTTKSAILSLVTSRLAYCDGIKSPKQCR